MKYPFDLKRALRGDELISRDGKPFVNFKKRHDRNKKDVYPYQAELGNYLNNGICYFSIFTKDGRYAMDGADDLDLFMRYPELKEGMKILVKEDDNWEERMFLFKDKRDRVAAVSRKFENAYLKGEYYRMALWKQWKLIEEPAIEISVKINGKEGKLSDISTETFEKLKELGL